MQRVGLPRRWALAAMAAMALTVPLHASDHADPIDILGRKPLEGGLTDLFFYPEGDHYVVILCLRRALTQSGSLRLEPYTYAIHMDLQSTVGLDDEEKTARYGGRVDNPEGINADVTIQFRLNDDATLADTPSVRGFDGSPPVRTWTGGPPAADAITVWSGITDDPFIFPVFFGTNVVSFVATIPKKAFPSGQRDWLLWGTSEVRGRQIDHVGRSLRTQNPRFELLNTLPPNRHVRAIREEHEHPSLMRDVLLRLGLQSTFAYRAWDQVPDVMIYTTRNPVGFPNGRVLEDDVAEQLAVYGDTLLKEISYIAGGWPRATTNDKAFKPDFPYLPDPWPDKAPPPRPSLTTRSKVKLALLAVVLFGAPFALGWLVAWLLYRRKFRLRYL